MIHPLLRLIATEPRLLGDHVEAYADLIGEEVSSVSTSWALRIAMYVAALCLLGVGLVLTGVAAMLWAVLPPAGFQAPWLLIVVPAVPLVAMAVCLFMARSKPLEKAFEKVKRQMHADMAMLREVTSQ